MRVPGDRRAEPGEHDGHMGRGLRDGPVGARCLAPDVIDVPQQRGEARPAAALIAARAASRSNATTGLVWVVMVVLLGSV